MSKENWLFSARKRRLIFSLLYPRRRKEKIQGTYFKICALYFKISQTYFLLPVSRLKKRQTKKTTESGLLFFFPDYNV